MRIQFYKNVDKNEYLNYIQEFNKYEYPNI